MDALNATNGILALIAGILGGVLVKLYEIEKWLETIANKNSL